jgi:hypothetical protein
MTTASLPQPDFQANATCPAVDLAQFSSFAADIDLTAQSGYRAQPARTLRVDVATTGTGDTLVVQTLDSHLGGVSRTLTVKEGDCFDVQLVKIMIGTTVGRVTVGW